MIRREQDEEAVSAAIATVLLFAGVLTIISGMMVTIAPVINEMHGSIERETMGGQMSDLASETERLSESGTPGDTARMSLKPHTGSLSWDLQRGGTWYSATHQENTEFRLDSVLDLDDEIRFRHPNNLIETLCSTDLHASPESLFHYRIPPVNGTITATPQHSLSAQLGPNEITFETSTGKNIYDLQADGIWQEIIYSQDGESWIHSDAPLQVALWRGNGGAFVASPDLSTPGTDNGRMWSIPLQEGYHNLQISSEGPFTVDWGTSINRGLGISSSTNYAQVPSDETGNTHIWSETVFTSTADRLEVQTSSDAQLILHWGVSITLDGEGPGAFHLPDRNGAWTGTKFQPPAMNGTIVLHNPSITSTTAKINGLYHSISGLSSIRIAWNTDSLSWIDSTTPITVEWILDTQTLGDAANHAQTWRPGSLSIIPAADTGRSTGMSWSFATPTNGGNAESPLTGDTGVILQPAAPSVSWLTPIHTSDPSNDSIGNLEHNEIKTMQLTESQYNTASMSTTNGPARLWVSAGGSGATMVPEDGYDRCINIDTRASGWIEAALPWETISQLGPQGIRQAWRTGDHFFGIQMTIRGGVSDEPHVTLGTAWALNLPRLTYTFDSSVSDLEIISNGGFVGTNHPEYKPSVLVEPPSREGPGPRVAVTIPLILPTTDSIEGATDVSMTLSLNTRDQLASMTAYQVRRGWDGPYAEVIAANSAASTDFSADWLAFPGQLQMLNDYVGWVQTSPTMPEVVYHAGGDPVKFNIQVAQISSHAEGGESL